MFVTRKKFESACANASNWYGEMRYWRSQYGEIVDKWNSLVERVNKLGGEQFLQHARVAPQLDDADLDRLIRLCHPDKHGGSQAATEITQKLLAMRAKK